MKICACITEYNPFHLGHLKHIEYMKNNLHAEKIIAVMSGNFVQRGDASVLNKYTRARHAILAGADIVLELPTVFATANAEVFAKGAVNLICDLNTVNSLCFGAETADMEKFIKLAKSMNNESKEFKKTLKGYLSSGVSLAKAKFLALQSLGENNLDESLISSPNNILGLEYTKALLKNNSDIEIFPLLRENSHNDDILRKGITSATSIRNALKSGNIKKLKKCVPPFVYSDLGNFTTDIDKLIMAEVYRTPALEFSKILDCTEGLENRIKALSKDNRSATDLIKKVSTKRYTEARIRRILFANLLKIKESLILDALNSKLYAKVLAVNANSKDLISILAENSNIPILTRKSDCENLKGTAKECFEIDTLANDLYNLIANEKNNEYQMIIV